MEHASRRAERRQQAGRHEPMSKHAKTMYMKVGGSLLASLAVMYPLAFSQVDQWGHIKWSLSVFWISLSMVSAMGMIMLVAMWKMLPAKRLNVALLATFAALLLGALAAGRVEAGVGDDAFLRSMIPHHSRAIHMCQEASLADSEIVQLCGQIIQSQTEEISQMEGILARRG